MYALYQVSEDSGGRRYQFQEQVSLFGRNAGYIPSLLAHQLDSSSSEPMRWRLEIAEALAKDGRQGSTLVINLQPNLATPTLSLFELLDVWGYSDSGWTPIMLRLRGLLDKQNPEIFDENDFMRRPQDCDEPIFSMTYLKGTIQDGAPIGRWTAPGPSPTNSVLLWPEVLEYFWDEARRILVHEYLWNENRRKGEQGCLRL